MNEIERATSLATARRLAAAASTVTDDLKPGTYDAATALALTSIAHSLSVIAESTVDR